MAWLTDAKEAIMNEAPLLAQEILLQGRYIDGAFLVAALIIAAVSITIFCKNIQSACENPEAGLSFALVMVRAPFFLFFVTNFCFNIRSVLSAWITPRLYILEYIADKV